MKTPPCLQAVRGPISTRNGRLYAWRQLLVRAGLDESSFLDLNLTWGYGPREQASAVPEGIWIEEAAPDAFESACSKTAREKSWIKTEEVYPPGWEQTVNERIPVLFWGAGRVSTDSFVSISGRQVVFHADLLATVYFLLTRWEEMRSGERDVYGRFPAQASLAWRAGFLDRPVVDEYALVLQAWIKTLAPGAELNKREFSLALSHDVDLVRRFSGWRQAARTVAGDLLKRGRPRQAFHALSAALNPAQDPCLLGVEKLVAASEQHGQKSAFYFMAADPSAYEPGYSLASPVLRRCLGRLLERGHELGFHPSYRTVEDPARFAMEKSRLEAVVGSIKMGGRQHFLRFRAPQTWRMWENAGMLYDSTLGYADCEGFRCGSCIPFRPFDIEADREMDLEERPLVVMDGTLWAYRHYTSQEAFERVELLYNRCRAVGGVFTLLWHNTSLDGEWAPYYRDVYLRLLRHHAGC